MNPSDRNRKGLKGREWALSKEAGFTSHIMTQGIVDGINETIDNFNPRPPFDLIEVTETKPRYVEHKLTDY